MGDANLTAILYEKDDLRLVDTSYFLSKFTLDKQPSSENCELLTLSRLTQSICCMWKLHKN